LSEADGAAERQAALAMIAATVPTGSTVGGDKN